MKKSQIFAAVLVAFLLLCSGCDVLVHTPAATEQPDETAPVSEAPGISPSPAQQQEQAGGQFTLETRTVYFPEGSREADAEYVLSYTLPLFSQDTIGAQALNAALALYEEELTERVRTERLPLADRVEGEAAPSTTVSCDASYAGGYWNIRLFETVSYGAEQEVIPYALVLDEAGSEQSFAAVSGQYEPDALVAQQIYNAIDQQPEGYFGDVTPEDVRFALDLMNGFAVTETGYEIFIRAGVLAPEELGPLTFSIERAALYPDCVGEAISAEEYELLLPALQAISAACAPNYESFSDGSPSAYAASVFLTNMLTTGNEADLWVDIPAETYEAAFSDYFTGTFPADLSEAGDGTTLQDGAYRVPVRPHAAYALRVDDAVRTEDALILYGMLLYGMPGTEEATELSAAVVTLAPESGAPVGFRFVSVELT